MITTAVVGDCLELRLDRDSSDVPGSLWLRFSLESDLFMPAGPLDSRRRRIEELTRSAYHAFSVISSFAVPVTWHPNVASTGEQDSPVHLLCFPSFLVWRGYCEGLGIIVVVISELLGLQC